MDKIDGGAVLHVRVSPGRGQTGEFSLDDQEQACAACAAQLGPEIRFVFREDGVSGTLYRSRPDLHAVLRLFETGQATVYITHRVDRCGRDVGVLRRIRQRILKAGGRFFLSDGTEFPDTSKGNARFNALAVKAEDEHRDILDRTATGRAIRAGRGQQPCRAMSPFGLHVVTKDDVKYGRYLPERLGHYIVVEEKAPWVRGIFGGFRKGRSLDEIIVWLHDHEVPSPSGCEWWNTSTLVRMLRNPVYKGAPQYGRTKQVWDDKRPGSLGSQGKSRRRATYTVPRPAAEQTALSACEALVTPEEWEACQRKLATNKERRGNPDRRYYLSGLVFCPRCGATLAASKSRYRCPRCKWRIDAAPLESAVTRAVVDLAGRPGAALAAIQAYRTSHWSCRDADRAGRLEEELARLERRLRSAPVAELDARADGRDPGIYKATVHRLVNDRTRIEGELSEIRTRLGDRRPPTPKDMVRDVVACVRTVLTAPTIRSGDRNRVVSAVVAAVRPSEDGRVVTLVLHSAP